jgi:ankyrin repeat protein
MVGEKYTNIEGGVQRVSAPLDPESAPPYTIGVAAQKRRRSRSARTGGSKLSGEGYAGISTRRTGDAASGEKGGGNVVAEQRIGKESVDAFFAALQGGDPEGARNLLGRYPALASARDPAGVSALMLALYHRHAELALAMAQAKTLDVWEAAATGAAPRLRELLRELPFRAGETAPDGFSPLGFAAFFGHEECARILVEHGAEIDACAKNPTRVAPLHSAIAGGHHGIIRLLIERGARVNIRQQHGFTPLHGAAATGDADTILVLLTAGADPSLTSDDGKTPLDVALDRGHARLAGILDGKTGFQTGS